MNRKLLAALIPALALASPPGSAADAAAHDHSAEKASTASNSPLVRKVHINNHYNGTFLEPWGERSQRGYGIEVLGRFLREVATVEFGGPTGDRPARLAAARELAYNDVSADRQVVAAVQAMEAILARHAAGTSNCVVQVDHPRDGLVLLAPGRAEAEVLYPGRVTGGKVRT